jgi:hypothetical protein
MSNDLAISYSKAAHESWQDIFYAVEAKLIEPSAEFLTWGCPNNPWVIDVNRCEYPAEIEK